MLYKVKLKKNSKIMKLWKKKGYKYYIKNFLFKKKI